MMSRIVSPVRSLAEWCKETGTDFKVVRKEQEIHKVNEIDFLGREISKVEIDLIRKNFLKKTHTQAIDFANGRQLSSFVYKTPLQGYARLSNASVAAFSDYLMTSTGCVLSDVGWRPVTRKWRTSRLPVAYDPRENSVNHFWPIKSVYIDAEAIFIGQPPTKRMGHWIIFFMTRLKAIELTSERRPKLVIFDDIEPKFIEYLEACGIEREQLIFCPSNVACRFSVLHVLQAGETAFSHPRNSEYIYSLHQHISQMQKDDKTGAKKIYLTRRDVRTRQVVEEERFEKFLIGRGISTVCLSDCGINKQATLFKNASIIISPLGSNTWASLFAPLSCKVLEIWTPAIGITNSSVAFANIGIDHKYFVADKVDPERKEKKKDFDFDFPLASIEAALDELH